MRKEIIFNATDSETRIAITEDGRLVELHVETPEKERYVGNIYLARIAKIMPGIRAAFIDVGLQQDAFLHFSDVGTTSSDYGHLIGEEGEIDLEDDEETEGGGSSNNNSRREKNDSSGQERGNRNNGGNGPTREPWEDLVRDDSILVQVTKEPTGNKGVRVTSEISLPGRFLVLMPFRRSIGVSKRVSNFREKKRLRYLVRSMLPQNENFGVIIRTVAIDQDEEIVRQDLKSLIDRWHEIEKEIKVSTPSKLVYKEVNSTSSVLRDLLTDDVERVWVDNKNNAREIRTYLEENHPSLLNRVELYKGREPIFDVFGVEQEIAIAMQKKVPLKSGGSIVIEQTEAMVVVDVNTGRFAKRQEQELNSLQTDMEAAREITRQLRLRDIGGIIVVDFIDLEEERNRKRLYDEIRKELRKDRAKSTILPMSEFGIVQMTRQRVRQSVMHSFSEPCPLCNGSGILLSKSSVAHNIERWIRRFKAEQRGFRRLILHVNSNVADYLHHGLPSLRTQWMLKYRIHVKVQPDEALQQIEFQFYLPKNNEDITSKYNK
ncbi:MAG: Rne/Rng family ribonuclease [Ignavibacteriales bacterium]|nr:Rne/Rng family ribonuclease [Ignavibacteriales bacterium]